MWKKRGAIKRLGGEQKRLKGADFKRFECVHKRVKRESKV